MPEVLTFDPTDESSGSQLQVTLGTDANYSLLEQSYPQAPLVTVPAGSIDTEGERIGARKHGNRTITHRWDVLAASEGALETAVNALTAKVAKLGREGGTFRRTSAAGEVRTYDVLAADDWTRPLDITYYTGKSAAVSYTLTAKPYSRGAEQDLGDNVETTLPVLIFTEAVIPGDVSALGRLVIDDDRGTGQQKFLLWGIESRYYDADPSEAGLFYEAESQAMSAAASTALAGASGGNVAQDTLASADTWIEQFYLFGGPGDLQHQGAFRVWARLRASAANRVQFRAAWDSSAQPGIVTNDPTTVVGANAFEFHNLGLYLPQRPPPTPGVSANQGSTLRIDAKSSTASDVAQVDYVLLQPIYEGSGQAEGTTTYPLTDPTATTQKVVVRHDGVWTAFSNGDMHRRPYKYEGDHLYVPCSGAEARTVRVVVKWCREPLGTSGNDPGIDDLSARLYVTPRYL